MKKLFVHHPLFRLLSPVFSGILVYLLILLINNTIEDLAFTFFTQELYVCIGLSYLIQEVARLIIILFNRLKRPDSFLIKSLLHVLTTIVISVVFVTGAMYLYFKFVLSYAPNAQELLTFNAIFSTIAILYVLLYLSNQFLYKINTEKLEKEEMARIRVEEDFAMFKQDINPKFLMESLEAILVLMKNNPEKAESLTEEFASVYRYILTSKNKQLVQLSEEIKVLKSFVEVLNELPHRKIKLSIGALGDTLVVPGSLLNICENILRSTIPSVSNTLTLDLEDDNQIVYIKYKHEERLFNLFTVNEIEKTKNSYSHYSSIPVEVVRTSEYNTIKIPKLTII